MQGDIQISFLSTEELRDRLKAAARQCRTSMSRLIEKALESFLDAREA